MMQTRKLGFKLQVNSVFIELLQLCELHYTWDKSYPWNSTRNKKYCDLFHHPSIISRGSIWSTKPLAQIYNSFYCSKSPLLQKGEKVRLTDKKYHYPIFSCKWCKLIYQNKGQDNWVITTFHEAYPNLFANINFQ